MGSVRGWLLCGMCVYMFCGVMYGVCMFMCVCVWYSVYVSVVCDMFISRKQIHMIPLTFKSQQKDNPVSSPKYMSRGNSNVNENQPPC